MNTRGGFAAIFHVILVGLLLVLVVVFLSQKEKSLNNWVPTPTPTPNLPFVTSIWKTYKNSIYDFEIKYPKELTFEIQEDSGHTDYTWKKNTPESPFPLLQLIINVYPNPSKLELKEFYRSKIKGDWQDEFDMYGNFMMQDIHALEVTFRPHTYVPPWQYFVIFEKGGLIFVVDVTPDSLEWAKISEMMLYTFKFTD